MKRILLAAVAAASLSAAPAQAQDTAPLEFEIKGPATAACITPVTTCVDYYGDLAVRKALEVYETAMDTIQKPPPVGTVCELIWEGGCSDAVPF